MKWRPLIACGLVALVLCGFAIFSQPSQPRLSILANEEPQDTTHRKALDRDEIFTVYVIENRLEEAIASLEKDTGVKAHRLKTSVYFDVNKGLQVRLEQTSMPRLVKVTVVESTAVTPAREFMRALGLH